MCRVLVFIACGAVVQHGQTALMVAACEGHAVVVERLVSGGASIDLTDEVGGVKRSGLMQGGR